MSVVKQWLCSWQQLHDDSRILAQQLLPAKQWCGIMAVSRGGLAPAAIIARELNIRLIETVCIQSYDHDHQHELSVLKAAEMDGERWLIIDDLSDTGETAKTLRQLYPKAYIACVYSKPLGQPYVDCFAKSIAQDTWIQLPWDMALSFVSPLSK